MSHRRPQFPTGHPFEKGLPPGASPFEIGQLLTDYHRARGFGGWTMKDPDPDDEGGDGGDDDEDTDPETEIVVGGKKFKVGDLARITTREKKQGKRAGVSETLTALGVQSLEEAKSLIEKAKKPAKKAAAPKPNGDGGGGDDTTDEALKAALDAAAEERRLAAADRAQSKAATRRSDLRGALRVAGVDKDDLDDALAMLDPRVEAEYDEDDIDEAIEDLRETRAGAALFSEEEAPEKKVRKTAASMPTGRPASKPRPKPQPFGAGGRERAKRKGWIKTDA